MRSLPPVTPGLWVWTPTATPPPGAGQVRMWHCQPGGPRDEGRGCLPTQSQLCRASQGPPRAGLVGAKKPPVFIRSPPHLMEKDFSSPHLAGSQSPGGQAASPVPCRGGAWQCPLARLSVCSSGWCQPCSLVRTKLSFSAEGRTRDTGKGRFWKLLLLTRRVGPGYLPRPLARKREARLQGTSWTVGRADP